ncbi:MAG: hypothetical protein A4E53_01802 [Pelotomaculum sp. PtaB.Bin104]|nr:MAG: hypothetical protein A4E53_01802 [Pelotomaculum sp. PtaB.Bin104]
MHSGTVIRMLDNNNLVALMGTDVMKALMEQEFPNDEEARGPSLLYVMGAAGIGEFKNAKVIGLNGGSSFQAHRDEINEDYILCLTDRGTVGLCTKRDYRHFLVEDVSEINIID